MIDLARRIAYAAHEGQTDKQGQPYILHPERVATCVELWAIAAGWNEWDIERVVSVAWLHDVVEDTAFSLADLTREGFPPSVVAAVDALTRHRGPGGRPEGYHAAFIPRCKANEYAALVKRADLRDNLARLDGLPEAQRDGMRRRYERALAILEG
jgi:(p)ppGpp synthase/HD superfamily hydrolase